MGRPDAVRRRDFLRTLVGVAGAGAAGLAAMATVGSAKAVAQPPRKAGATPAKAAGAPQIPRAMTVYKDPNCGCCKKWVEHVQAAGFVVTVHDTADMPMVKTSMGVPDALQSCHTARVGTYTVEGHVPADLIERALRERPVAAGLAVPGMPNGSPGMEGMGKDRYDVMLFDKSGKSRVYASR